MCKIESYWSFKNSKIYKKVQKFTRNEETDKKVLKNGKIVQKNAEN